MFVMEKLMPLIIIKSPILQYETFQLKYIHSILIITLNMKQNFKQFEFISKIFYLCG